MRISDWSSDVCSSDLNRPEYGELMAACFKGRLTHVNINYRYRAEEVFYIFDDSDSEVIVYSSEFRDTIVELNDRLRKVRTFVEIGELRSEEHTSELQSLMRISYAVFCLKNKKTYN